MTGDAPLTDEEVQNIVNVFDSLDSLAQSARWDGVRTDGRSDVRRIAARLRELADSLDPPQ